jgi:hypothetical protein
MCEYCVRRWGQVTFPATRLVILSKAKNLASIGLLLEEDVFRFAQDDKMAS